MYAALILIAALGVAVMALVVRVRRLEAELRNVNAVAAERTADLAAANEQLEELATSDPLTQLANRRRFAYVLDDEWRRGKRANTPLALLMIDVDFFKRYNDTHGHPAGDECLRRVAHAIDTAAHRTSDLASRYGGEEFAVVLAATDLSGATIVAESIRRGVEALRIPHGASDAGAYVTVSVGVAVVTPAAGNSSEELVASADKALYRAKDAGRNRVVARSANGADGGNPVGRAP